ncbi:hypothetical protein BJP27_24395 (plasmid) [Pseudomonas oryzihabitans]|nr:hypothetical protein BJP27_24395 [Pseudomonas psychrotolerans]
MSNLPFVQQIIEDLRRFKECVEDDQDVNLGRDRFDLLTQLGLLERVQRSPALWVMSQAGEDAIALSRVGEPLAWMTKPLRGSNAGKLCLCDPSEARDPELWATPFPVFATRRAAAVAAGEPVALSKEAISTIVGMVELCLDRRYCMGMDEGFKSFEPEVEHDFVKELRAFVEGAGKSFTAPPAAAHGDEAVRKDAERYRWLRNPGQDVALVLDKKTGHVPVDERGFGGYGIYEYRAGTDLDEAIDAAMRAQGDGESRS